jgi:hypothetical protein
VALAALVLTAGSLAGSAAAAKVPTVQTFSPTGLGLSFTLPADWGTQYTPKGLAFVAAAPGYIAWLQIIAGPTTKTLNEQAANFLAFQRQVYAKAQASFHANAIELGGLPAVLILVQWSRTGAPSNDTSDGVEADYLFKRGSNIYVFEYATTVKWLAKERPLIAASAKSIRPVA